MEAARRFIVFASLALAACASAPSPLAPAWRGSIGTANHGVLADGTELACDSESLRWLRTNDRHWGLSRFTDAIARAARDVARDRPGPPLYAGDLSARRGGGPLAPHFSHRSGIDADLLFYFTTLDGVAVDSRGFFHVGADGIARDESHDRWLRLDVAREWLLVKALVDDPRARVQWIFVSDVVQAMLVEWALARGDSTETIHRAREVMRQPHPGGVHDDHIHVRSTCSSDETVEGCELAGPRRAWLSYDLPPAGDRDEDLAVALLLPPETYVNSSHATRENPEGARETSSARPAP
ncbi:MAG: penicillin-insensitive murein endopeptidase [Myxococcota bacterium]|nr:penicillin-insensitive murein endopeptidase [Myxococcota bacterium]